jgi:hypothetical protein
MQLSRLTSVSLFFVALSSLPAQQPAAAASGPALVVRTADADFAEKIADAFDLQGDMPKAAEGECYVLSLSSDGKLTATSEKSAPMFVQVRAKPAMLAEIFADKIKETQEQISMFAGMAAGQMGVSPEEINKLVDDVFAFPKQLEALNVDVKGSEKEGFDGKVDVMPVAAGWFAKFIGDLQPNKAGAPKMTADDAVLQVAANIDGQVLARAVQPFLGFAVGSAAADKEERQKFRTVLEEIARLFDGTMSVVIGSDGNQKMLAGVADGQKLANIMAGEAFKQWRQASTEANPMAEVEIKEKALVHREVACDKQVTDVSLPNGESQTTTQFTGVAGSYMFAAGSEAEAKAMIDSVLDDKVARAALPGNAMLSLSTRMADMVRTMSGGMADGEGAPSKVDVEMGKQGSTLNFTFKVAM